MKSLPPTITLNQLSKEDSEFLYKLVEKGGPEPSEYQEFTAIVNNLEDQELEYFRDAIKDSLNENTLIGHGYVKPFGYPGDFTIIHNIYKLHVNPDVRYSNWDRFFQDQAGAHAVRNRKDYFLRRCADVEKQEGDVKRVLILGSGPATDVNEYLRKNPNSSSDSVYQLGASGSSQWKGSREKRSREDLLPPARALSAGAPADRGCSWSVWTDSVDDRQTSSTVSPTATRPGVCTDA